VGSQAAKAADENDSGDESDASDKPQRNVSLRGLTSISNSGPPPAAMAMKCRGCGGEGHTQARCPKAKCYACDGEGHMAKDCPRPRKGKKRETMAFSNDSKRMRSGN
jgi:DnaJ-class molecular chaperone